MRQNWRIILMAFLVGILLASCQPKPVTTPTLAENTPLSTQETQEQFLPYIPPSQGGSSNPTLEGESAYPPPAQAEPANPPDNPTPAQVNPAYNPYPGPSEGVNNFLDWAVVQQSILDGKVSKIYHTPTGHITLVLKDGSVAVTIEPAVGEVSKVIEQCGGTCGDLETIEQ